MKTNGKHPLIEMREIYKIFETAAGEFTALKGVNTNFYQGEFVSVVGKSGSGKSTLVNMISGIDRPTSGEVVIDGIPIHDMKESDMAMWRGENLGLVFQFYQLLPILTLKENVMIPMQIAKKYSSSERERRAMDLLDQVGLTDVADKRPSAVSGGQQQAAAVARSLANDPPIVLADEPTGNLDTRSADRVFNLFRSMVNDGKSVLMVTHDHSLAQRAERTLLIADGEVINETIANTLPLLTHGQMLKATKGHKAMLFEPGEAIIQQGTPNDYFYMITDGLVDIFLTQMNQKLKVASLGEGQYFGEMELLKGADAQAIADIKANPHGPVEVIALNRQLFNELMAESTGQRQAIEEVAEKRMVEHKEAIKNGRLSFLKGIFQRDKS